MPDAHTPKSNFFNKIDEKLFRLLINQIEDYAIFMLDPNGYILSWNQGAENIKGYTADEIIGQHLSVFYTAEDRQKNEPRNNLNEALKKNIHESEGWRVKKDGTKFWANIVFTTIYDENDHLIGFAKITRDITERKKNEDQKALVNAELERRVKANTEKAIAHERRFRKLIENSYDGISLFDKNLHVFYRSRSAQRINGWNDVERSGKNYEELVHPDDLEKVKAQFTEVLAYPDNPVIATYRNRHKMGHYIWIECLLNNRLHDPDINAIVCNFRDVSEKIKAGEQIKDKTEQIENILESITDGFIAVDKNFNYTYANRKIGEMLGCNSRILIGKNVWETYADAIGSATYNAMQQAMEKQQYTWNEDFYAPLGLWQENHIYPTPDGLSIFIRDITERKLAEASLMQSESNLRSVFENSDLAIILFDMQANIIAFNDNASQMADMHFHKVLKTGLSAFHYCSISRRAQVRKVLQQLKQVSPIVYEVSYPLAEQQTAWYEVRWVSVRNTDHEHTGVILTLKDITEKKQAELERDRITKDLIQRNSDLEQFTYIVSHNLRAPVANIQGLSEILIDMEVAPDTENTQALKALSTSVCNLDKVILDLNHILQVDSTANATLEMVSLPMLVDEVKSATSRLTENNHAVIHCNFDEVAELMSLKSYLYSIFQNLIVNSIKYKRPGVNPVINISTKLEGDKACIYFKDNGKGIDIDRYKTHLFGLYKRFDLTVEGKGVGLFMVKMQTERLGGKINIQSCLNAGTEFKLEFPLKAENR